VENLDSLPTGCLADYYLMMKDFLKESGQELLPYFPAKRIELSAAQIVKKAQNTIAEKDQVVKSLSKFIQELEDDK
jgi:hypothetical protein